MLAATASYASAAKNPAPVVSSGWVELTAPTTIALSGSATGFTYTPTAATVFVYDSGNPAGGQGTDKIETLVESLFSLPSTGTGSLKLTGFDDLSNGKSGSFNVTSSSSFDYLAVHYGGGELVFHWNTPVAANSLFTFTGLPNGISNYRAFSTISAVPEPSTYGMLLGGLALMGVVARRRARK
ncbi:PEP-CTERM sorting domain-containing protein [Duganella radicis]|uniref:PEP-CTERM sorting domain-containing protein n=1 Tax=Duganella radicis TaxID=551988 RepID=UPI001E4CF30D|nr:PEP-CTERM sorting domain-containing protein [Duganella radicis]